MASLYYLGVDGGGSKTLAVIVDEQGRECGRGLAGSANYVAVGLELAIQNIYSAVMRATHEVADALPLCKAWLGLAGVDRPSDSALLVSHLHTLASSVQITNDADLALSALPGVAGIVLIVGTGSIALGRNEEGSVTRVGGWGHILGDEGSGYDIGRQGLRNKSLFSTVILLFFLSFLGKMREMPEHMYVFLLQEHIHYT